MDEKKDKVLQNYANSGYDKNLDGWYFNPYIDEYDEDYDPHKDPLFNEELTDPVLKKYRAEGYDKNVFGWYFNPYIDEYDEDYDPHNDPEYNSDLDKKNDENASQEDHDQEDDGKNGDENDGKNGDENDGKNGGENDGKNNGENDGKNGGKNDDDKTNEGSSDYETQLGRYKKLLAVYKKDLQNLYDHQQKYKNGEIEYSEYEEYSVSIMDKYKDIKEEYDKIYKLYEQEMAKNGQEKPSKYADLSDEEIAKKIEELEEERTEEWNYRAHEENGMEGHEDDKLDEIEKEIDDLKKEQKDRTYRNMSEEELEAELAKINEELDDLYHYGAHELNGLEDAGGDKWAELNQKRKQIEEELNRRKNKNKDIEKPEEPEEPKIIDKDKEKDPDPDQDKDPQTTAIAKSGLQIFREQFNQMPEIKDRHTASERFKIVSPLLTTAGICSLALIPGIGTVAAIGVSAASIGVPIIAQKLTYRLTGQKKLENQIKEQFLNMDPDELDKMVDYLTEEQITELKPNAVILKALHEATKKRTKEKSEELKNQQNDLLNEREELLSIDISKLSEQDRAVINDRLGEINERLVNIEKVEAPRIEKQLKDIKRGKDRVSAAYKGNLKTRFNILAHRNSSTEEYKDPINELADAELARDTATARGDNYEAGRADSEMKAVMQKHTRTNALGIQNGVFNARQNPVKIISDLKDNTIKYLCTALTIGTGITVAAKNAKAVNDAQKDNKKLFDETKEKYNETSDKFQEQGSGITKGDAENALDGTNTTQAAYGEAEAINRSKGTSDPDYYKHDQKGLDATAEMAANNKVSGNSFAEWLRSLASGYRGLAESGAKSYADSVQAQRNNLSSNANDHEFVNGLVENAPEQNNAMAKILEKMAEFAETGLSMGKIDGVFKEVAANITGALMVAAGAIRGNVDSVREDIQAKKDNKQTEISDDEMSL